MEASFGSRLRAQRERQQVALAVIAEQTKIKMSMLEGLERDDVSQWPMGIFRRSFVRAYAQAIGMDPDVAVREFLERYPDPVEEDIPGALAAAHEGRRPQTRIGYLLATAFGALPGRAAAAKASVPREAPLSLLGARSPVESANDSPSDAIVDPEGVAMSADVMVAEGVVAEGVADLAEPPCEPVHADTPYESVAIESSYDGAVRVELACAIEDAVRDEPAGESPHVLARDLSAIAGLCTRLARTLQPRDVTPILEDAAAVLRAIGVIVWMWDPATRSLRHVLAHGYSIDVLARLPRVRWETDNAIADAFRSADTRVVKGSGAGTGAVVVPIVTPAGCTGVLALELADRGEERESVRALATILAAQLAALCGLPTLAEAVSA